MEVLIMTNIPKLKHLLEDLVIFAEDSRVKGWQARPYSQWRAYNNILVKYRMKSDLAKELLDHADKRGSSKIEKLKADLAAELNNITSWEGL